MNWRDWAATDQDFAALARLNTVQYPDAPLTAEGVRRNWGFTDPQRPFLLRFAVRDGQEVALVESYPQGNGVFLLELIASWDALNEYGTELLEHARQWAKIHGAKSWAMTLRRDDNRAHWLQEQGFHLQPISTEWTFQTAETLPVPAGIHFTPVGVDPHLQNALRETLNAARQEANLPPFTAEAFIRDVLNFGVYRPDLLWLAQNAVGEAIGCACLHVWEAGGHGEFSWVSVAPSERRKGIATTLLARASRESGLPHVSANLPTTHQHLSHLLKRAGFQEVGAWVKAELELNVLN